MSASESGAGGPSSTLSASEIILAEVLQEAEAAVAASRLCARTLRVPELEAAGQSGLMLHVFSCVTCAAEAGAGAVGVCEACALSCHIEHELVDVGVRTDWLCDCATPRSSVACAAGGGDGARAGERANAYGHNFEGRFCSCDRPYDAATDTLTQCLACGEWWHPAHTPGWLPGGDGGRIVCRRCVAARP